MSGVSSVRFLGSKAAAGCINALEAFVPIGFGDDHKPG